MKLLRDPKIIVAATITGLTGMALSLDYTGLYNSLNSHEKIWGFFPPSDTWPGCLRTLATPQVQDAVNSFIAPFGYMQKYQMSTEFNLSVYQKAMRTAIVTSMAAISSLQQLVNENSIKDKSILKEQIEKACRVYNSENVHASLQNVIPVNTLQNFLFTYSILCGNASSTSETLKEHLSKLQAWLHFYKNYLSDNPSTEVWSVLVPTDKNLTVMNSSLLEDLTDYQKAVGASDWESIQKLSIEITNDVSFSLPTTFSMAVLAISALGLGMLTLDSKKKYNQ